ncbi:MAG: hypothetical protein PVI30_02510 [Myxococcales bacterium]|jgi:hypothetical protein
MVHVDVRGRFARGLLVGFALLIVIGCGADADDDSDTGAQVVGDVPAPTALGPTGMGAGTGTGTGAVTDTSPGAGTDTGTDMAAGTDTGTDMDTDTGTDTDTDTGTQPVADAGTATEGTAGEGGGGEVDPSTLEPFSFFVTSLEIMRELSGSQDGFGGDFGGLEGADSICQQAAAAVGFGAKTWRAFLSATDDGNGNPVHAIERIGEGPWYDRNGRLVAENIDGLLQVQDGRPQGDPQTVADLPNEFGEGLKQFGDTHDVLTGTNEMGQLDSTNPVDTCNDWTSTTAMPEGGFGAGGFGGGGGGGGGLRVGHAWPAQSGNHWITAHTEGSCAPGVNLIQNGPGDGSSVGAGGGWGAIYCFALQP